MDVPAISAGKETMKLAVTILATAALLSGCAAAPPTAPTEGAEKEQSFYVTGSRIPRKTADPSVTSVSRQDFERARNESLGNPPNPQRTN